MRDAVREPAIVTLAEVELRLGKRCLEVDAGDALADELSAALLEERDEALRRALVRPLELEEDDGLGDAVEQHRVDVVTKTGLEEAPLEGRLVAAHEGVEQDVRRQHAFALGGGPDDVGDAHGGVLGSGGHRHLLETCLDGRLEGELVGLAGVTRLGAEEAPPKEGEDVVDVEVTVEDGVAVGEVVVAGVGLEELLVGELRDGARVATALEAVAGVGEEPVVEGLQEDLVGIGVRALHLVEDDAVVGEGGTLTLLLVVPALLLEDAGAVVDVGVQDGIQVDVHEVHEVLLVGGRHGVHGLVGERERVEEGLHGALEQVDERFLDREALAAAQDRVLEDVEDARVVGGRRLERDGEGAVGVGAGEPHGPGACLHVAHDDRLAADLGDLLDAGDLEALEKGAWDDCRIDVELLLCAHAIPPCGRGHADDFITEEGRE